MVREQLAARGIRDERVLGAMGLLPRHLFVDEALAGRAYSDATLPIGAGQTLSQPYTVARMTEALRLTGEEDILEIGTGSGYQTAVLASIGRRVFSIERIAELAGSARRRLLHLGFSNVFFREGDGSLGWHVPRLFHRILVTAGAPVVPERLGGQLLEGGVLLLPEGEHEAQNLVRLVKVGSGELRREVLESCRFVPLVGAQGWGAS
ncbi:MAG: protein-L-isoaspartate(D-aspartate) O-methyltransferase [Magnetococcales bacterium]|nr:protein-L-isoaspartate(D-aspartate) O-methyltransferase [Magnetococcales bacterium]